MRCIKSAGLARFNSAPSCGSKITRPLRGFTGHGRVMTAACPEADLPFGRQSFDKALPDEQRRSGLKSDLINAADPIDEPSSLWVNMAASVSAPDGREFDPSRPNPLMINDLLSSAFESLRNMVDDRLIPERFPKA